MFKKIAILCLLAIALLANANEEVTVTGEIRMDENITTTTGFESTVKEQVKNVTVISRDDIEKKGYKNIQEVLRDTPGITFVDAGGGASIDMRGQGDKAVSKVKVLVDGVMMNLLDTSHGVTPINTIGVSNIERIEIIPGGGAVLYGNGTVGGVVNIITKKPTETGGRIGAEYGSHYDKNANAYLGFKINEQLYLNFDYSGRDAHTYRDKEEFRNDYWAAGIRYDISDRQSLAFKGSRFTEDGTSVGALTQAQMDQNREQAGSSLTNYDETRTEFVLDYGINVLDNLRFDITGYWQEDETKTKQDAKMGSISYTSNGLFDDEKFGINLKGKYNYSKGELIFGYNYLDNDMKRQSHSILASGATMSKTTVDLGKVTNSLYILEKHNILDNLQIIGGFREEWAKYTIDRTDGTYALNKDDNDSNSAWELALNYLYRDTGNVYMRYEHGFLSPTPTQLTNKDPLTGYYLNDLKSETYDTYEIGMKDVVLGSYVSLTGFYTKTKDEISQVFTTGHGMGWEFYNLDETERYGIEAFAEQYFGPVTINESIAYIDAEITSGSKKGQNIPYVSDIKATIGVKYEIIKNLNAGLNFNYYGDAEDAAGKKVDAYSTTDFVVSYDFENGIGIIAGVNNLFNEKYNTYQSTSTSTGVTEYKPADEINYYVGVRYAF